jgi:pantoate--beta-alanine ligase
MEAGMAVLRGEGGVRVDYLAVVDAENLLPVERVEDGTLVAVAAYVGTTRLIDNFLVAVG